MFRLWDADSNYFKSEQKLLFYELGNVLMNLIKFLFHVCSIYRINVISTDRVNAYVLIIRIESDMKIFIVSFPFLKPKVAP